MLRSLPSCFDGTQPLLFWRGFVRFEKRMNRIWEASSSLLSWAAGGRKQNQNKNETIRKPKASQRQSGVAKINTQSRARTLTHKHTHIDTNSSISTHLSASFPECFSAKEMESDDKSTLAAHTLTATNTHTFNAV